MEGGVPSGVRRRKAPGVENHGKGLSGKGDVSAKCVGDQDGDAVSSNQPCTYWLTRIILLRFIAFIYGVAFLVAYFQNKALLGSKGLLPADNYLRNIDTHAKGDIWQKLTYAPSVFWWFDFTGENVDLILDVTALAGVMISLFVLWTGGANMIIMATLWVLYHSINSVGQRWYSFGWESQLLESGFLAIFLCPLLTLSSLPQHTQPPTVVIWAYRWLILRIMIGAGMIKMRGDQCWRDLTCMNYHYQTQPVPNPLSYYLHQTPEAWHKIETAGNHFVELIAPWLMIFPHRGSQIIGGAIQVLFQVILISSGNLSFLNWLTILPCLACFDDASLLWMFGKSTKRKLSTLAAASKTQGYYVRKVMELMLGVLIAYLSIPVVQNLLSSRQAMNTSFDPLRLVNTYGAFGSITRERTEVIMQGTYGLPDSPAAEWLEYEFKCKPGNVSRVPCLISPYHYRLDWLMWFSAFQSYQHNPWLVHLIAKLLVNDELTTELIEYNPFRGRDPPKYIRLEHYLYEYTKIGSKAAAAGKWWTRKKRGSYLPAVRLDDLQQYLKQMGWR